jgi:hypothetical protein
MLGLRVAFVMAPVEKLQPRAGQGDGKRAEITSSPRTALAVGHASHGDGLSDNLASPAGSAFRVVIDEATLSLAGGEPQ